MQRARERLREREREEDAARFPSSGRHFTNIYSKEMPLPQSPQNGVGTEEMREMSKGGETGNEAFSRARTYSVRDGSNEPRGIPIKKVGIDLVTCGGDDEVNKRSFLRSLTSVFMASVTRIHTHLPTCFAAR